ncbi:unnamed protein product [Trichogramma brassicae]|uniref:Uncharacterized protein n=1 Tax=Trichogramma brassicae TaxID=86971 RepID=A0A6H5JA58_9HYME|nr:unnamed protein product [Trichogramma brassicae]
MRTPSCQNVRLMPPKSVPQMPVCHQIQSFKPIRMPNRGEKNDHFEKKIYVLINIIIDDICCKARRRPAALAALGPQMSAGFAIQSPDAARLLKLSEIQLLAPEFVARPRAFHRLRINISSWCHLCSSMRKRRKVDHSRESRMSVQYEKLTIFQFSSARKYYSEQTMIEGCGKLSATERSTMPYTCNKDDVERGLKKTQWLMLESFSMFIYLKRRIMNQVTILTINQGVPLRASCRSLDSAMTFPEEVLVFSQDYPPGWRDRCTRRKFGLSDVFPRGSPRFFARLSSWVVPSVH